MSNLKALGAIFLAAATLAGCKSTTTSDGSCSSDSQCPVGTRCDTDQGLCVCATDEACMPGYFCNHSGVCQGVAGCSSNQDCPIANTYCDALTGKCLIGPAEVVGSACGLASHCPYGSVCTDGACVEGCFDDGDCELGRICLDGQCTSGAGLCTTDAFCGYGERCDDATSPALCKVRPPWPVLPRVHVPLVHNRAVRRAADSCLVNSLESGGFSQFCGVHCSLGQECPNGHECHGVVILTQDVCTFTAECRCDPSTIRFATATCTVAAACDPRLPDGSPCTPDARACTYAGYRDCNGGVEGGAAACIVTKGQTNGNCTCATNDECGEDAVCVAGVCCTGTVRNDRDCALGENRVPASAPAPPTKTARATCATRAAARVRSPASRAPRAPTTAGPSRALTAGASSVRTARPSRACPAPT